MQFPYFLDVAIMLHAACSCAVGNALYLMLSQNQTPKTNNNIKMQKGDTLKKKP